MCSFFFLLRSMLTTSEKKNLADAFAMLDSSSVPKEIHVAVPQQRLERAKITSPVGCLPTFTTVDQLWHRELGRWLCAEEKLAAMGFPIGADIARAYGVDPTQIDSWKNLHERAGNSQHLPQSASWHERVYSRVHCLGLGGRIDQNNVPGVPC